MAESEYDHVRQILAANIRRRRKELGRTQEAVAQNVNLAPRHFQKLEAGELNVTLRTLCRVARALDTTIHDLFAIQPTENDRATSIAAASNNDNTGVTESGDVRS